MTVLTRTIPQAFRDLLPFMGVAHVGYVPNGKVAGLSKLARVVEEVSKRPQVQERLTVQIANEIKTLLDTEDVAVVIDADHLCVSSRGIQDVNSSTVTAQFHGKFQEEATKQEFLQYIGSKG